MPIASVKGFVLGNEIVNEQDKLVTILTERSGILKGIAPGACKSVNRFGSLFELFSLGDFRYNWKENRNLVTISGGDIVKSYFSTVSRPENIFVFYLMGEILFKLIPPESSDNRTFRLVRSILDYVAGGGDLVGGLAYFLIWVLRIEGLMFNPYSCSNCGEFILTKGWMREDFRGLLCEECKIDEREFLEIDDLNFIRWSEKKPPGELVDFKGHQFVGLIRKMVNKVEVHGEINLKSVHCISFIV